MLAYKAPMLSVKNYCSCTVLKIKLNLARNGENTKKIEDRLQ